jgi:hydrogenase expression/formation protein HypC
MCLALPGELLEITADAFCQRSGLVAFGNIIREVNLSFLPDAKKGDFVLVHVGFAISKIDAAAATRTLELFAELDEMSATDQEQTDAIP